MNNTELVSIPAFARLTGLKTALARELVKRGDIPSIQVGPRRRIDVRFIEAWTASGIRITHETKASEKSQPL
jgi:hypothetical protein